MEGFTYATVIDLNMGSDTIKLDPDAQKIGTSCLPWGKYSYIRLPMGISGAPVIFQEKTSNLMRTLEHARTHIDDLLITTMGPYDNHFDKIEAV